MSEDSVQDIKKDKKMEYKFPDEPPIGSKVEDKDGKVWQRSSVDRWTRGGSLYTATSWKYLVDDHGPLKDYVEPKNGDVRRIKGKSNPGFFEVYIEGAWYQYFKGTGRDVVKYDEPVDW